MLKQAILMALSLAILACPHSQAESEVPVPAPEAVVFHTAAPPVLYPVPDPWSAEEVEILAKMLWGEARGIPSKTEQAACVWTALNRADAYDLPVTEVVTAPAQFSGYRPGNPVDPELAALAEDVLDRWYREKDGEQDVGRVLPAEYLWFRGDGQHNHFRDSFRGGRRWDWSLPSPYES